MLDRLRRQVLGFGAYPGLRHWLLVRGSVLLAAFALLYIASGRVIGWKTTYDVMVAITSPGDVSVAELDWLARPLAWLVSIAGWLAAPAVCGAVAGAVVSLAIGGRRRRSISQVLTKQEPAP